MYQVERAGQVLLQSQEPDFAAWLTARTLNESGMVLSLISQEALASVCVSSSSCWQLLWVGQAEETGGDVQWWNEMRTQSPSCPEKTYTACSTAHSP